MAIFWKEKSLAQMNQQEWEQLCDGCGKCCVHKLIADDEQGTPKVHFTSVACKLFDPLTCQCSDYKNRLDQVSTCLKITVNDKETFSWLPTSCSYRLLSEGHELPDWHHLNTMDHESIHLAGESVKGTVILETDLDDDESLFDYIFDY